MKATQVTNRRRAIHRAQGAVAVTAFQLGLVGFFVVGMIVGGAFWVAWHHVRTP